MSEPSDKYLIVHPEPDGLQCDVCSKMTKRLHYTICCQIETWACDQCFDYDAEAYGEEPTP